MTYAEFAAIPTSNGLIWSRWTDESPFPNQSGSNPEDGILDFSAPADCPDGRYLICSYEYRQGKYRPGIGGYAIVQNGQLEPRSTVAAVVQACADAEGLELQSVLSGKNRLPHPYVEQFHYEGGNVLRVVTGS